MTYRDRTFCRGDGCAKFDTCPRALTDKVKRGAEHWFGSKEAPISVFCDPQKLACYEAPKTKDETK